MKGIRLFISVLFVLLLQGFADGQSMEKIHLVGNKTGLSSVNRKQMRDIFRGTQSIWKTGEQVIVVMPSGKSDLAPQFSESILQMSYPAVQKFWLALVFQGRASAPVFLNNSIEILDYVKRNPGAIGVVNIPEKEISSGLLIPITD